MDRRSALGRAGEDEAERLYKRMGFEVLERNYRCSQGEIDLVARRGGLLVFCEVKTRRTDAFGLPAEAVGYVKQQRIKRLAGHWLATRRCRSSQIRFDVVSVLIPDGAGAEVTHIPDAF